MALLVQLDQKETPEHLDLLDKEGLLVQLELQVQMDPKDHRVLKVILVLLALPVQLVILGLEVIQGHKVLLDKREILEPQGLQGNLDLLAQVDHLVIRVQLALQETLDCLEL